MPKLIEVELHSNEPSAVEAVRSTLKMLPMGGAVLHERDGKFYVPDGFAAFACENQGYVRRVIRTSTLDE